MIHTKCSNKKAKVLIIASLSCVEKTNLRDLLHKRAKKLMKLKGYAE